MSGILPRQVPAWDRLTGTNPNLVEVYLHFGNPLPDLNLPQIIAQHATPLVQVDPWGRHMVLIASGRYDQYLHGLGRYLGALHVPVAVSIGAEENGPWFPWGCKLPAASYIASWRHFEQVIKPLAPNVVWTWIVNKAAPGTCPPQARYPGDAWVDWVGLDSYWRQPGNTWATTMEPTIRLVRAFTSKPILITETGAKIGPDAANWISSLFTGAENTPGIIGITWFNSNSIHGDYRLQKDPRALRRWRADARTYMQRAGA